MLANNANTKTHSDIIENSIPNLVSEGSHFGVEQTTLGEEELIRVVQAYVHAGLWTREDDDDEEEEEDEIKDVNTKELVADKRMKNE